MAGPSVNPLEYVRRLWFPTALVVLLVLAIPGIALLVLTMFDQEATVNKWLEDNVHLSYSIPIPMWGAVLLLLVPFAILILYFLKLKRKPLQVPSTFLWRKSVEDLHVNALLQWLRQNVLLLLQVLTVIVLIYAIMAFRFHGRTGQGKHYIIMIDNSASMSATDVSPSRLDWAKAEALKEIDAATDNDFGMVIAFNSSAQTLASRTSNRDALRQAVKGIEPTQRPTRIDEALALADSLANPTRSTDDAAVRPVNEEADKARTYVRPEGTPTDLHLFSDGRFPEVPDFALGNLNLIFHSAGLPGPQNANNIGIVRLSAFRDENDATKVQIFTRIMNCRPKDANVRVQIEVEVRGDTRKRVYAQSVAVPGRAVTTEEDPEKKEPIVRDNPGEKAVTFDLKEIDDRSDIVVYARVLDEQPVANGDPKVSALRDHLALDDEAWLVLGVVRKARVLLVTKGNDILEKFFTDEVVADVANITKITPDTLEDEDAYLKPARAGDFDLVIFDRCSPGKEDGMPRANTLFIGHPPPGWRKPGVAEGEGRATEKLNNPPVKGWMSKHPLMRYLQALHRVRIDEAFRMKDLPPRTPLLMESDMDTGLLFTLSRQAYTDLIMAFPLMTDKDEWNTTWPLDPSFPLFLQNVLYTLGNVQDAAAEETIQPGQVKILRPDVAVDKIEVTDPSGKVHKVERGSRAEFSFGATDKVGVYRVGWDNKVWRSFAVNLLDPEESNLEPRGTIQIGRETTKTGESRLQTRPMWKWVILAALLLLLFEWYIYNRRVYI